LPLIELGRRAVKALGEPLRREILFSGFESVAESFHNFVCLRLWEQCMNHSPKSHAD